MPFDDFCRKGRHEGWHRKRRSSPAFDIPVRTCVQRYATALRQSLLGDARLRIRCLLSSMGRKIGPSNISCLPRVAPVPGGVAPFDSQAAAAHAAGASVGEKLLGIPHRDWRCRPGGGIPGVDCCGSVPLVACIVGSVF
jgi:hypothetical protein